MEHTSIQLEMSEKGLLRTRIVLCVMTPPAGKLCELHDYSYEMPNTNRGRFHFKFVVS